MGMSEGLSDDGEITGRGGSARRGFITGFATFVGGTLHALPFLINDVQTALMVVYPVVLFELFAIAWIRKKYLQVSLVTSLIHVTVGGIIVSVVGILVGHA